MAEAQGTIGRHIINEDFYGSLGKLRTSGVGTEVITYTVDETDGVVNLETGTSDGDNAVLDTGAVFSPATNGPLSLEVRVKLPAITACAAWVGFTTQAGGTDEVVENGTLDGGVADAVGFYFEAGVDANQWYQYVATGSAETRQTIVTGEIVADKWEVLRVEVDPDGTVRLYRSADAAAVGGGPTGALELLYTSAAAAVSTTALFYPTVYVATTTTALKQAEVDYFHFTAARDWTI